MKKLMLLVGVMSASMVWAENVSYRYYDATEKTFKDASTNCTVVTSATREFSDGGWYAVTEDVTITDANITVSGSAHLILCDGKTLTITDVPDCCAAIDVSVVDGVTNSLSICGQTAGTGGLDAVGGQYGAGIGGRADWYAEIGWDCGVVTINGGTVTVQGGLNCAGIGGGMYGAGGTVTVNGGMVTAMGSSNGAGIGGGFFGAGGAVTINGGEITAQSDWWGAGIGRGCDGEKDGTVVLDSRMHVIYGGLGGAFNAVRVTDEEVCEVRFPVVAGLSVRAEVCGVEYSLTRTAEGANVVTVVKGEELTLTYSPVAKSVIMTGESVITRIVQTDITLSTEDLPEAEGLQRVSYRNWTGEGFVDAECYAAVLSDEDDALLDGCWYAVTNNIAISGHNIAVSGSAHLILCDGATLTILNAPDYEAAIDVSASNELFIYGQSDGTGSLSAVGGCDAAGIGGCYCDAGGRVTINGGQVTATGGEGAAGIGGGEYGAGGRVTINGGTVVATGRNGAAGIGRGCDGGEDGAVVLDVRMHVLYGGMGGAFDMVKVTDEEVCTVRFPVVDGLTVLAVVGGVEYVPTRLAEDQNVATVMKGEELKLIYSPVARSVTVKGESIITRTVQSDITLSAGELPTAEGLLHVSYQDWTGSEFVAAACDAVVVSDDDDTLFDGCWYVVTGAVERGSIAVDGAVRLILTDGAELNVQGEDSQPGLDVGAGNELVVYGQAGDMGSLMAMGGYGAAGIGGCNGEGGGRVTINGGTVTATGTYGAAGIGGGFCGDGGAVTINGGMVTAIAVGMDGVAGIGGGAFGEEAGAVTFGGGFVGVVRAGADEAHASFMTTEEYAQDHSAAYVALPVAVLRIPRVAGISYVVSNKMEEVAGTLMGGTYTYEVAVGDSLKLYFVLDPNCTYTEKPKDNPMDLGEITGITTIGLADLPTVRVPEIAYLDWEDGKLVEKKTTDYLDYCGAIALADGVTYVVQKDMTVDSRIHVNGTVDNPTRLILCDGATLSATQGVEVSVDEDNAITHALIICGQTQGSGTLIATGSEDSAGIGGGINGAGGAVTINGGTVMATGGEDDGAGIGGGIFGDGGTVTINGGTVTARGAKYGAGIGGGWSGAVGRVTINGGKINASGGECGEDIGRGYSADGNGTVTVLGGLFWEGLKDEWIAKGCTKFANDDTKTKDQYPWTVLHRVKITLPTDVPECSYVVSNLTTGAEIKPSGGQEGGADYLLPVGDHVAIFCAPSEGYMVIGTNPYDFPEVTDETAVVVENLPTVLPARTAEFFLGEGIASVSFTTEPAVTSGVATVDFTLSPIPQGTKINIEVVCADGYDEYVGTNEFAVGEEDICVALETSLPAVEYCDAQGQRLEAQHVVVLNARAGNALGDGKWYLITGTNEVNRTLAVRGEVNLILMDGAKLTVVGEEQQAGVTVAGENSLTIWGQSLGTGELVATGGDFGAGIGSGNESAGGTVTINGGKITAQGGEYGAGIGGGIHRDGGNVAINGGTVTATGRWKGAGIGGGYTGAGGTVTITGGKVVAHGDEGGEEIGHGFDSASSGTVTISGGIFGMAIPSGWCAPYYFVIDNSDPETREAYPWAVVPKSVVTVGDHPHTTAAYTYGDGSETNVIGGTSFEMQKGTLGVQIIFTLEHHYQFVDVHETGIRVLDSPLTKDGYEVIPPEVEGIPGTVVSPWSVGEDVTAYVSDAGALLINGTGEMDDFASEDEAPWAAVAGAIKEVTVAATVTKVGKNALAKVADGVKVNGTPLSTYRTVTDHTTTINGISLDEYNAAVRRLNVGEEWKTGPASELVVPDDMVLVTKESIQAAQAMTVEIVDGQVELGVSVLSNADFTVSTANWAPVKFSPDTKIGFSADGTKLILSIPVSAPQGFMILQSGDANNSVEH